MNKLLKASLGILIDLGSTMASTHDALKAEITGAGWQVIGESNTDENRYLDLIPPAAQMIGNSLGREVTRLVVKATSIELQGYLVGTEAKAGASRIQWGGNTSAPSLIGLQVGSTAVTTEGVGGYDENTEALYNALQASTDAEVNSYKYTLVKLDGSTSNDYILAEYIGTGPSKDLTRPSGAATGLSVTEVAQDYEANTPIIPAVNAHGISIDLASGFIYFLSVTERSIILATKTTTDFYGPIIASYADHASALAQTPPGCVPVELGLFNLSSWTAENPYTSGRFVHCWGMTGSGSVNSGMTPAYTKAAREYQKAQGLEDLVATSSNSSGKPDTQLRPLNTYGLSASRWEAVTGENNGIVGTVWAAQPSAGSTVFTVLPTLALPDVLAFIGAGSDESLQFTKDISNKLTLASDLTANATDIVVNDGSTLPDAGMLIVNDEVMEYTAKAGGVLTLGQRGLYGTSASAHANGSPVWPVVWFMKAGGGALPAGSARPS